MSKTDREKGNCSHFNSISKNICALLLSLCSSVRQTIADMMSGGRPLTLTGEISHKRCQAKANEEKLNSSWCFRSIFNKLWLMTVWFSSSITNQGSPAGAEKQLNQPNLFWQIHPQRKRYGPRNTHRVKISLQLIFIKTFKRIIILTFLSLYLRDNVQLLQTNPFSLSITQRKLKGSIFFCMATYQIN